MKYSVFSVVFFTIVFIAATYFFIDTDLNQSIDVQNNERVKLDSEIILRPVANELSNRMISVSTSASLPVPGSAPTEDVAHTIPLEEIRRGCLRQDCIPAIEKPQFMTVSTAQKKLPTASLGIALSFSDEDRFYPFPMLETHELVNDVIDGEPVLISYCPLCGTGIVFNRRVADEVLEFGVSGMLWQSNVLMYNRSENVRDRNLWSQVLGEAVVGDRSGTKLAIIPSDIMNFSEWAQLYPTGVVLDSGRISDPYGGEYFSVAQNFAPNFDEQSSPLPPMAYVFGISVDSAYKAYPRDLLPEGRTVDELNGRSVVIHRTATSTVFMYEDGITIPDVEGFWFSWIAAHPDSELWSN